MDKLAIVMSNYIDVECDANTSPRQAYERGFRRAAEKCETVMRSRKAKNDALESENAKLRELVHKQDALTKAVHAYWAGGERSLDDFNVMMDANAQVLALMRELRIEVE